MNQEAAILHQLEVHRDGRGGPCGCLGSKTSQGQVLQRAWSNGLVLKCDFCLGFTPALIYSELEVALGHQVEVASLQQRTRIWRGKEAFKNTEAVEVSAAFLLKIPSNV